MGKPLSRPDCLRQSPACLGKGEDEDGYIEDCYVPQRSIYDTMRINEQIDQGGKPNQPSKNTLEKGDGSTISSNGTLGAPSALDSKVPESKKLDERVIFDALKLSSDVSKSAPAPPRRRPNPEKKENVNRRSWKSFMPPNFPEFAERIEASLSEVSEAGVSSPSLQEKQGSATKLAEGAKQLDRVGSSSEPLTMEHPAQLPGVPEIHEVKQLSDAFCGSTQDECQPLLEPEDRAVDLTGGRRRDLSSATWPRAMKNLLKAGLNSGRHDTLEADDTDCVVEMVPLSPCLSEELLDPPGMGVLITPNLREKTESELRFEEDERLIMMEAEEELEEGALSPREKAAENREGCLTGLSEERGQSGAPSMTVTETAVGSAGGRGTPEGPSPWQELWDESEPLAVSFAPVPQETHPDLRAAAPGEEEEEEQEDGARSAEAVTAQLREEESGPGVGDSASLFVLEQFSDTDSVQMFLELEELCMGEEDREGASPGDSEVRDLSPCSGGLGPQEELEQLSEKVAGVSQQVAPLEASVADSAVVSDLEDFDATYGSQVASTTEPTLSESYSERETSGDSENVMFPSPPGRKDGVSHRSLSSLVSQIEEYGTELSVARELSKNHQLEEVSHVLSGEPLAVVDDPCSEGGSPCGHVFWAGREVEEETPPAPCCGTGRASPNHDELAMTAEELDSQVDLDVMKSMEDSDGKEPCYQLSPSERTDLSNWDVPELVSEDEVAELDKETFCGGHAEERGGAESSWVPFQMDFALREDSEEPVKGPDSSGDLEEAGAGWSCQLECLAKAPGSGAAVTGPGALREETPKTDEQERDSWEPGDLEALFGQGGDAEGRGRAGSGEEGLAGPSSSSSSSSSLVSVEDLAEAQPSLEDVLSTVGEEAVSASPLASDEGVDAPEAEPPTTAGSATFSLPTLFASAPGTGGLQIADATSFPSCEEPCGPDGPSAATWVHSALASGAGLPSMEEISLPLPFCVENRPTTPSDGEEKLTPEELPEGGEVAGSSEELIQATQEVEDLATLSSLSVESLEAQVGPPELEGGCAVLPQVLWASSGTLSNPPLSPASTAPDASAMPGGGGLSTKTTSSFASEGPPDGTDGLVPDDEVHWFPGYAQAALSLCREVGGSKGFIHR